MPTYTIECRVTLEGATMVIEAENKDEAMRLARNPVARWDDIEYDTASLVDWEVTGHGPVEIED